MQMKTIFGLFENFEDAGRAINQLMEQHFDLWKMNIIVSQLVAKNSMDVDLNRVKVGKTDNIGEHYAHGIDWLLGGQQPVKLPDVGPVYAAGELATILVRAASAQGAVDDGLQSALEDFDVPEQVAGQYRTGIKEGGLLFFLRTDDQRAAQAVMLLRQHNASHVANY